MTTPTSAYRANSLPRASYSLDAPASGRDIPDTFRAVGGNAPRPPLLSELKSSAGADHAPGSAARNGFGATRRMAVNIRRLGDFLYWTAIGLGLATYVVGVVAVVR